MPKQIAVIRYAVDSFFELMELFCEYHPDLNPVLWDGTKEFRPDVCCYIVIRELKKNRHQLSGGKRN